MNTNRIPRILSAAILATVLSTTSCHDGRNPSGVSSEGLFNLEEGDYTGLASDTVYAIDNGQRIVLDAADWSFAYPFQDGLATRGFVPSVLDSGLTVQQMHDTLPYYRPSAAHIVAGTSTDILIPLGRIESAVFEDSSGTQYRMEVSSGMPSTTNVRCLPEGCPMSNIRVYDAPVGGRLLHETQLDWGMSMAGYELKRSYATFFDSLGQKTVEVVAPVVGNSLASSAPVFRFHVASALNQLVASSIGVVSRIGRYFAPRPLYAQGTRPCQTEAWVGAATAAAAATAIRVARASRWLDPVKDMAVVTTVVAALAANARLAQCMQQTGMMT